MSNLTKEECENAIYDIEQNLCELEKIKTQVDVYCIYDESLEIFKELMEEHFDNQLTSEEIDFLLMSEEERVNTYKNYEEIWKSCVSKLEKQKEIMNNVHK